MPFANAERLRDLISGSSIHELAGVGHLVPQEAGGQLAALVEGTSA
jgi:hypothetical protein